MIFVGRGLYEANLRRHRFRQWRIVSKEAVTLCRTSSPGRVAVKRQASPWMLFGHTHYPMLCPTNREGTATRYANSGTGVLDRTISAIEWDPTGATPVRLVLWTDTPDGPERYELLPDGDRLRVA